MKKIPFATFEYLHSFMDKELRKAINDVYESGWFISGKQLNQFEEDYARCN